MRGTARGGVFREGGEELVRDNQERLKTLSGRVGKALPVSK